MERTYATVRLDRFCEPQLCGSYPTGDGLLECFRCDRDGKYACDRDNKYAGEIDPELMLKDSDGRLYLTPEPDTYLRGELFIPSLNSVIVVIIDPA
ncbi:MAG: hypothetical protein K2X82_08345 [Gemmataceae bacterium]|nr:hypothetical protein [Gemmataceae bacterium]